MVKLNKQVMGSRTTSTALFYDNTIQMAFRKQ